SPGQPPLGPKALPTIGAAHPFFFLNRCPPKHRVFHQNPHFRNPLPPSGYIINIILNFVL
ncbi:hypothetical protein BCR42DRAFT_430254, partial [Absidia repens]